MYNEVKVTKEEDIRRKKRRVMRLYREEGLEFHES